MVDSNIVSFYKNILTFLFWTKHQNMNCIVPCKAQNNKTCQVWSGSIASYGFTGLLLKLQDIAALRGGWDQKNYHICNFLLLKAIETQTTKCFIIWMISWLQKQNWKINQSSFLNWTLIWQGVSHLKSNKVLLYVLEKNAIDMNKE